MSKTIIFATSNKGKVAWLEQAIRMAGISDTFVEMKKLDLIEIQSSSIEEVCLHKAQQAYALLKQPVLTMDNGFFINELNGFPGPFASYMVEQMGIDAVAKLVGTLTDKSCKFRSVVTYMDADGIPVQFSDDTGDIFTLTEQVWPQDHPKQWSTIWRIIVPSGLGYTEPLAAFDEAALQEYIDKRTRRDQDSSCMHAFVDYLKDQENSSSRKFGT